MSQRQQKPRPANPDEAETFQLWVFSDAHVATDKAVSAAIRNGMEFIPPAAYPETLASALRQSENGGDLGGPPFRWDIALDLGDNAGLWDLPDDEQGREVARQYGVLTEHRREQIYPIAGNHDASPGNAPSSAGKPANWWFRKWVDPMGENTATSGVDASRRPYPIEGSWERYSLQGRQHPFPDDERSQRSAVSGRAPRIRRRFAGRGRDQRYLGVVAGECGSGRGRNRHQLPSSHAARNHGGVRRF